MFSPVRINDFSIKMSVKFLNLFIVWFLILNGIKKLFLMPNYTDRGLIFWHWFYGMRFTPSITMKTNSVDQMYAVWNIGGVVGSPQNYRITSLRRRGSLVAILTFYKLFYSIQNRNSFNKSLKSLPKKLTWYWPR